MKVSIIFFTFEFISNLVITSYFSISFAKTLLEKQENLKEISNLVSMACGKDMQIKYITDIQKQVVQHNPEDDIKKLASDSNIQFNVIE